MEQKWATPDDPIFQLTPPIFTEQAQVIMYQSIGQPAVSLLTFWDVYLALLSAFHVLPDDPELAAALAMGDEGAEADVLLLCDLQELWHGDNVVSDHGYVYYGGLKTPPINVDVEDIDIREYADFSN